MTTSADQPIVAMNQDKSAVEAPIREPHPVDTVPGTNEWPADLFPLPISAFERLMWDDDHRSHPRVFTVLLEFHGQMERTAFENAVRIVVRRNPLLSSILQKINGKWCWVPVEFPESHILWEQPGDPEVGTAFNLRSTPGFQAKAYTDGQQSELRLVFHHAVADGHGARRVIIDWLTSYAKIATPDARIAPLDNLNYELLHSRARFQKPQPLPQVAAAQTRSPGLVQRLRTIYEFFSQQPVPVRSKSAVRRTSSPKPHHLKTNRFCRSEVKQFRDRLRGSEINLNDVAVALLLNCIARWNRSHGETGRDRLYRVLIPADLREPGDELMPAANKMSFLFIARPTSLCLDWHRLLPTIRAEMDYIEQHGSRYNLVNALPVAQSAPGLLKAATRLPVCFSTAVLTNLGDTVRRLRFRFPADQGDPLIGNLRYIRASGAPPLRPQTCIGIGLTISFGEMVVQCQVDSNRFNEADSAEFQKMYVESWMNWSQGRAEFA